MKTNELKKGMTVKIQGSGRTRMGTLVGDNVSDTDIGRIFQVQYHDPKGAQEGGSVAAIHIVEANGQKLQLTKEEKELRDKVSPISWSR